MFETASPSLAERTTLRLGGTAIAELTLADARDLELLPERLHFWGGEAVVLGAGSNILAQDGELAIVLLRPNFMQGPEIVDEQGEKVFVLAGVGVPLPRLLRFCFKHGLSGLEGLVGVPGSVGGAVAMNAGSFGTEICACIERIRIFSDGIVKTTPAGGLKPAYRSLVIPEGEKDFIILDATFGLTRSERGGIGKRMRHNFFEKKSKQPVTAWSAGCIFKNPASGAPAGRLLEQAGYKGRRYGGMAFSSLHANFLINEGKGSATAALDLLHAARDAVWQRFGIMLEPEVRIVPCRSC